MTDSSKARAGREAEPTPLKPQTSIIFTENSELCKQLTLTVSLVNLLLFAVIVALILKLGWMGLMAVVAFF